MMKWAMVLALVAGAPPVAAALVATAPVADARLHIEAVGEILPDTAAYTVRLEAAGANREGAQKALEVQQAELSALLGKLGVDEVSFGAAPEVSAPGAVTVTLHTRSADEAARKMAQIEAEARIKAGKPAAGTSASSLMRVTLRDLALQDKVEAAMAGGSGFALTQGTRLFVADPAKAHRAAVAQALAKARAEGEAYAAALGWRITGIAGVSNAKPGLSAADLIGTLARVDGAGRAGRAEVLAGTSYAAVAVDFTVAR
jgi:uncharacterized protein YggE